MGWTHQVALLGLALALSTIVGQQLVRVFGGLEAADHIRRDQRRYPGRPPSGTFAAGKAGCTGSFFPAPIEFGAPAPNSVARAPNSSTLELRPTNERAQQRVPRGAILCYAGEPPRSGQIVSA